MKNWEKIRENKNLKEIQIKRSQVFDLMREFFKNKDFLEIKTPVMVASAGQEPYLDPMEVSFKDEKNKSYKGFLITSPEYSLKKMLVAGFDKIFELATVFRGGESFGGTHNPEFTMLEWYRANSNYNEIMEDLEELILFLNKTLNNSNILEYQSQKIDLTPPWQRMSVREAFLKYANVDLDKAKTVKSFQKQIQNQDYISGNWDDMFCSIFLNEIEPNLPKDRPVIIYDYPLPQAALAKRTSENSFYAERFELFMGGIELANAFSELTDSKEQLFRFKSEQRLREKMGKTGIPIDKDFILALKLGMPPSGGIALGVDRLQMMLLNLKDINDLLPLPDSQLFN